MRVESEVTINADIDTPTVLPTPIDVEAELELEVENEPGGETPDPEQSVGIEMFFEFNSTTANTRLRETFETVSQNLKAYPAAIERVDGLIYRVVYTVGSGVAIVKTIYRTSGRISSIVLSGSVPKNISLTKTMIYTSGVLSGFIYS